ncbi:3116_t:CDS:2 [Funneliformis geosporum]|uniref:3116_t:CDS:1 n=1 Tax=Funneliformis geosporum TaxID=1117311 RepID=A0A9W4T258_9GLOM|nr:3116_t:CDS:2 [Funneliformis geosporum]
MPGWEDSSWGYHSDDEHVFFDSEFGQLYGPEFKSVILSDVV